jgi:hypothetical protein
LPDGNVVKVEAVRPPGLQRRDEEVLAGYCGEDGIGSFHGDVLSVSG